MTPEEYVEYKDRMYELIEEANKRGVVEEALDIYTQNFRGAIVEEGEGHIFKDIMPGAIVRRINVQKVCEELEKLLNPN